MANLEPTWVASVDTWWTNLLGPTLSTVWAQVQKNAGSNGMLEKAHGELVRRFERELDQLEEDVGVFEALAATSDWAPFAGRARDVLTRVKAQWTDPAATQPAGVAGPVLGTAKAVVRGINVTVTAIGVAWAVASLADLLHTRKLLRRWAEHIEAGIHPSKRDRRQAHVEGVAGLPMADELGRGGRGWRRLGRRLFGRGGRGGRRHPKGGVPLYARPSRGREEQAPPGPPMVSASHLAGATFQLAGDCDLQYAEGV